MRVAVHRGIEQVMKRHHWLLVGAAAVLAAGWLLWNVLLVESDVATPPAREAPAP